MEIEQREKFLDAVARGVVRKNLAQPKREYLGASYIANECSRQIQYQYQCVEVDEGRGFSPRTLMIFERGHNNEEMTAKLLRDAGFILKTHKSDGQQFGFAVGENKEFRGHADGIITGFTGSDDPIGKYPCLWEHKCLNHKNFTAVKNQGLKKAKPVYYGQISLYQNFLQLSENPCVFTVINADTMELHVEFVEFDEAECTRLLDKAADIILDTRSDILRPRAFGSRDSFGCKFCDFQDRCWADGA